MDPSAQPYDPLNELQSFQHDATLAIGPSFIGWSLQLLISGATFHAAITHLHPKTSAFTRRTRLVTWAVCTLNFVVVVLTFYEVYFWGSIQATNLDTLYQFTTVDAIVSIPTGILAAIVQAFFARRAWKVVNKSKVFLAVVGLGWITALAGSMATAAESLMPQDDDAAYYNVLVVTQVWLWSSAFVDLLISTVLVTSLYKYKEGWMSRSNDTFAWLMQLAFQTVALTTLFVLAASILALVTYKYNSSSVYYALQYPIPALYAFSFIWGLDSVAAARKKQNLPSSGHASSSVCTVCQNQNFGIWPYTSTTEHVALPTLQQALTRHEEPGTQSTHSQMSLSGFLKPPHHACKRSKAGAGSMSVKPDPKPASPPSPDLASIQVAVETAHRIEMRTPGTNLSRSSSSYFPFDRSPS